MIKIMKMKNKNKSRKLKTKKNKLKFQKITILLELLVMELKEQSVFIKKKMILQKCML